MYYQKLVLSRNIKTNYSYVILLKTLYTLFNLRNMCIVYIYKKIYFYNLYITFIYI